VLTAVNRRLARDVATNFIAVGYVSMKRNNRLGKLTVAPHAVGEDPCGRTSSHS
jgi:hypothetical protein